MVEEDMVEESGRADASGRVGQDALRVLEHELRNPFHALLANLSLLENMCGRSPDGARIINRMQRELRYAASLIEDLGWLARPSPRRGRTVRLDELIEASVDICRHLVAEKDQRLSLHLPSPDTLVDVDPVHMEQVLINLLTNAVRYTEPAGSIDVSGTIGEDGEVEVEVRDTGCGLSEHELEVVFEPFFRSPRVSSQVREGLGLGLSLARELATLNGCRLTASSEGVGRGARFTLRLPRSSGEEYPRAAAALPQPSQPATARRVLLVEDDPAGAEAMSELLAIRGHQVQVARDAAAALAACRRQAPEVILLDLGLPDRSGLDLAGELRREGLLEGVRLVAVSGSGDPAIRRRSTAAGCELHLTKPVAIEELLRVVDG